MLLIFHVSERKLAWMLGAAVLLLAAGLLLALL
jgi:hypothetical protein